MKTASKLVAAVAIIVVAGFVARAEGPQTGKGKTVTLTGTITCAKCDLGEASKCATVIKVKQDGKDVVYYFDKDTHKKHHGETCMGAKEGTVTGVVGEADGKKTITVSKLEYK